jgi:hypothetical protein
MGGSGPDRANGRRALCGWSPPALPSDTPVKGRIDQVLTRSITWVAAFALVVALLNLAPHARPPVALALDGVAALIGGGICGANFWRCRHAHCLITSSGWLALSAVAFVGAGLGHSLIGGHEQTAFLVVLAVSLCFECAWTVARGTNAVGPSAR